MEKNSARLYPSISIVKPVKPKRLYAFPILGLIIKSIFVIPVRIVLVFLAIISLFVLIINSFVVLFTGKYWKYCYRLNLGIMRLSTKATFFVYGLTDKYPGFSMKINDDFSVDMAVPNDPKRLYAFPVVGFLIRIVLMIPYAIYTSIITQAGQLAIFAATFVVFFKGDYPESFYEIARDSVRVTLASSAYFAGFSDGYPSFWISMKHKRTKIILIVLAVIFFLFNSLSRFNQKPATQYRVPQQPIRIQNK